MQNFIGISYNRRHEIVPGVTLTLVDGGPGDADGVANGVIVDPSGPGFGEGTGTDGSQVDDNSKPISSGGGGGGSCFISAAGGWR